MFIWRRRGGAKLPKAAQNSQFFMFNYRLSKQRKCYKIGRKHNFESKFIRLFDNLLMFYLWNSEIPPFMKLI